MDRRDFIARTVAVAAGAFALGPNLLSASAASASLFPYTLPPLPYGYGALAPHFDEETMRIHHSKHHQAYVDKLNAALIDALGLQSEPLESLFVRLSKLPTATQTAIRNHGGGHWNHSFFWRQFSPQTTSPSPALAKTLGADFGDTEGFKTQFSAAAMSVFGSGWAWLLRTPEGKLAIATTPNQENPLMEGAAQRGTPLLALDVWEHAYYLHYQNRRADYVKAFWNVLNWNELSRRLG